MTLIRSIGTYLPPWGSANSRLTGGDEDAVTLGVAAGLAALSGGVEPAATIAQVVLVTRSPPLLEGGNSAALLAGLGLASDVEVVERLGGACATADALLAAGPDVLVIGVDVDGEAGSGAVLTGQQGGLVITAAARVNRSLPVLTRDISGGSHDYGDPRLLRDRGLMASIELTSDLGKPTVVAGLATKLARTLCKGAPPALPTTGASAPLFALAALVQDGAVDQELLLSVDQASLTALRLDGGSATVTRDEPAARQPPILQPNPGPDIPISLPAYDRAFDAKLRWAASRNKTTGRLDFPPRARSAERDDDGQISLVLLPRTGKVYTLTTVNVAVPGKPTPYALAIIELETSPGEELVRALVTVTGSEPGALRIGDRGRLVFRRVAVRSGVPDYSYAFHPDENADPSMAEEAER